MRANEFVILQVGIKSAYAIDLLDLARREIFVRIKAPTSFEQTLPSQNFVYPRNASAKVVRRVKQRSIGVGHLLGQCQEVGRNATGMALG